MEQDDTSLASALLHSSSWARITQGLTDVPDVILLSHGFQSEYEAGFANGLARNGVHVILIGSDTTLRDRIESSVKIINLRRSQDPRRDRPGPGRRLTASGT